MEVCQEDGCGDKVFARCWCVKHYTRWRKYGDPHAVRQQQNHGLTLNERLDARTRKGPGCWEWTGSRTKAGYGQLRVGGGPRYVHRLSYERHSGKELWPWHVVCHTCDNPKCLNPAHLVLGNQQTNVTDMWEKGRARPGTTRGSQHPRAKLTEDDVRSIRASGLSQEGIARKYGLAQSTVQAIISRKTWRHI